MSAPVTIDQAAVAFDNSFARDMPDFYAVCEPEKSSDPQIMKFNSALADELGLDAAALKGELGAQIFSGNTLPDGGQWLAQAYAGHQFGGFSPQLGDGRAHLLGELIDRHGQRRDIQLKGSGRTPFSRGGDGKAAVGPVLREYVIGEAMHALGIPTTRALAAVRTGDFVFRERPLPGAVLTRVAASHIRVGTFQFFAARGQVDQVRQLADYVIKRHYPELADADNPYHELLRRVRDRQADLVARWMQIGFIHGVMNTDNMAISGQTIDYGPCAFMDYYDPQTVFSSIDTGGRYAYANQPVMAQWNLARLAETLLPLIDENSDRAIEKVTGDVQAFMPLYDDRWLQGMRAKLGLLTEQADDLDLARGLLTAMEGNEVDYTQAMRGLADAVQGDQAAVRGLFKEPAAWDAWASDWQQRLATEADAASADERSNKMRAVSPVFIPRNHLVEQALEAAVEHSDYSLIDWLLEAVTQPFEYREQYADYVLPGPTDGEPYRTFCGT